MNAKRSWLVVCLALGAALLSMMILLWSVNRQLRQERNAPFAAAGTSAADDAEPSAVDTDELDRSDAADAEFLHVRNETSLPRRERSATNQVLQRASAGAEPSTPIASNGTNGAFETKLNTRIPQGYTLAFGGWSTESGNRALAFVHPAIQAEGGTNSQLLIRTTVMEVPPDVWSRLGLADIKADPELGSQTGLMSQQSAESLISSLTNQPNCLIVNRPSIQTSDGVEASLFVGQVTSGQLKGQLVNCLPRLEPDGKTILLSLVMKFGPQTP